MMRLVGIAVVAGLLTLAPAERSMAAEDYWTDAGVGLATVGVTLLYTPAKMLYALGGGVVGSLAYALTVGNLDAARYIWSPSVGGTWVLSPAMLRGKEPILFSGESYEPAQQKVEKG